MNLQEFEKELLNKRVVKSTEKLVRTFLRKNYNSLDNEQKVYLLDVAGFIAYNVKKVSCDYSKVKEMKSILHTAKNIKEIILSGGAAGYEVEFI